MVKNLLAHAGDTGSMGWEDPLEEEMATPPPAPVFLPGKFHGQRSLVNHSS